jgi:molybdenum cofactor cytidylyltransferase
MGQPKALLAWGSTPLIAYQIAEIGAAPIDELIVVLGHAADEIEPIVRQARARPITNPRYREGRSTSIARGMQAISPDAAAVLIANVDQPRPSWVIERLVSAHRNHQALISRPSCREAHGHPTIFDRALFDELRALDEDADGLKAVLRRHTHDIQNVPFDDSIVLVNLNRPTDYEAALSRLVPAAC